MSMFESDPKTLSSEEMEPSLRPLPYTQGNKYHTTPYHTYTQSGEDFGELDRVNNPYYMRYSLQHYEIKHCMPAP